MKTNFEKLKELTEDLAGMFGTFPVPAVAFVGINKEKEGKREKAVDGELQKK